MVVSPFGVFGGRRRGWGYNGGYMEQSRQMFTQMQEQMSKQAETLIGNLGAGLMPKK